MLGNMPGSMPMPNSGIMPQMQPAMPVPSIPQSPSVPPASMNAVNPKPFEQNPLGMVMKAILDPKTAAREMAQAGIGPEDLQQQIAPKNNVSSYIQPTAGAPSDSAKPKPFSFSQVASDLMQPIGGSKTTPPVGGQQPNTMNSLIRPDNIAQNANHAVGAPGQPFTLDNVMSALMQPIGTPPIAGQASPGANLPQSAQQPGLTGAPPSAVNGLNNDVNSLGTWLSKLFGQGQTQPGEPPVVTGAGTAPNTSAIPVVPPVVSSGMPPAGITPTVPIAPPVVPPAGTTTPTPQTAVDDYASGKIKSSVMGGAGGNAPDSQLKGNGVFNEFMGTIKAGGITNPNALAAIAATTKSESGFDEKNFYGSWSDPSESGQAGTSGGAMSWRGARFDAMKNFVKANGGDPNKPSAALQAKFFMQEDPNLIAALNAAKTPEEAQTLMNNAWKFKGYDNPGGGEAARRIALARNFAASGDFGDLSGIIPAANGGTVAGGAGTGTAVGGTGAGATGVGASGLTDPGNGQQQDLNLPDAPSPIGPRPGSYAPDANVQKLMLMLLTGLSGGGANIPTLTQLMNGQGRAA